MCNMASKLNDDGCVIDQITFETGEQIYLPGDLKFQKKGDITRKIRKKGTKVGKKEQNKVRKRGFLLSCVSP